MTYVVSPLWISLIIFTINIRQCHFYLPLKTQAPGRQTGLRRRPWSPGRGSGRRGGRRRSGGREMPGRGRG